MEDPSVIVKLEVDSDDYDEEISVKLEFEEQDDEEPQETEFGNDASRIATKNEDEHLEEENDDRATVLTCDECNKSFRSASGYGLHMRKHRDTYPHKCRICAKKCNSRMDLECHMSVHGLGKVSCPQCDFKPMSKASMVTHLRLHRPQNLSCPECDKTFTQSTYLKQHLKTHSETFPCPECGRVFLRKQHLKEHVKTQHQEESPRLKCTECEFSTKYQYSLKKHQKSKHECEIYTCPSCGVPYRSQKYFEKHRKICCYEH